MTLDEARQNIGNGAVYRNGHGPVERGIITSVGRVWVMVRYGADSHSKATRPESLTLLAGAK